MQSTELKEVRVTHSDQPRRVMYTAKEFLISNPKINITAGSNSSGVAARAAESLRRLGYITYEDVKTLTIVEHGKKLFKLIITVQKTKDFEKLYNQHEEELKKKEAEKKANIPTPTPKP